MCAHTDRSRTSEANISLYSSMELAVVIASGPPWHRRHQHLFDVHTRHTRDSESNSITSRSLITHILPGIESSRLITYHFLRLIFFLSTLEYERAREIDRMACGVCCVWQNDGRHVWGNADVNAYVGRHGVREKMGNKWRSESVVWGREEDDDNGSTDWLEEDVCVSLHTVLGWLVSIVMTHLPKDCSDYPTRHSRQLQMANKAYRIRHADIIQKWRGYKLGTQQYEVCQIWGTCFCSNWPDLLPSPSLLH